MKENKEMFEEWAKEQDLNLTIVDFSGCVNLIDKNGNQREWCYEDFDTDIAWEAWQASASQREGYVFTDKKKLAKVLNCVTDDWLIDTGAMDEFKEIESLVLDEIKAMLGVSE